MAGPPAGETDVAQKAEEGAAGPHTGLPSVLYPDVPPTKTGPGGNSGGIWPSAAPTGPAAGYPAYHPQGGAPGQPPPPGAAQQQPASWAQQAQQQADVAESKLAGYWNQGDERRWTPAAIAGWVCFGVGFFFPFLWIVAACLPFCFKHHMWVRRAALASAAAALTYIILAIIIAIPSAMRGGRHNYG